MSKHTPGPWRVEENTTLVWGACNPDDRSTYGMGYPVALMEQPRHWTGAGEPTVDTQIANARLIAAAPDMLEALREAEISVQELCNDQDPGNYCWVVLSNVRKAIAAATGEV